MSMNKEIEKNQILNKIKSKYIIKTIFEKLITKKFLSIISHNKLLQTKMEINLNDYKNYSEIYTTIEIKINTNKKPIFKFVNINEKTEENNFTLYLICLYKDPIIF